MEFLLFSAFTPPAIRDSKMKRPADVYFIQSLRAQSTTNSELAFGAEAGCIQDAGNLPGILQLKARDSCSGCVQGPGASRGNQEILPPLSRYVWSGAQLGRPACLPADTASPPSLPAPYLPQNGHLPCPQESLALPPAAQGPEPCVRVPQHGPGSGRTCEPLVCPLRVLATHPAAGRAYSWMPNNAGW